MDDAPLCECHGEIMHWHRDLKRSNDGFWYCQVIALERHRRWNEEHAEEEKERKRLYAQANPEKMKESDRRWREKNPDKIKEANSRRMYAGRIYLGRCGFTEQERKDMLNGKVERP